MISGKICFFLVIRDQQWGFKYWILGFLKWVDDPKNRANFLIDTYVYIYRLVLPNF